MLYLTLAPALLLAPRAAGLYIRAEGLETTQLPSSLTSLVFIPPGTTITSNISSSTVRFTPSTSDPFTISTTEISSDENLTQLPSSLTSLVHIPVLTTITPTASAAWSNSTYISSSPTTSSTSSTLPNPPASPTQSPPQKRSPLTTLLHTLRSLPHTLHPKPQKRSPTKALSIILRHYNDAGCDFNAWTLFPTTPGTAIDGCSYFAYRDNSTIWRESAAISFPPWPMGSMDVTLFGDQCRYESDGSGPGTLWCFGMDEKDKVRCVGDREKDVPSAHWQCRREKGVYSWGEFEWRRVAVCEW